MNTFSTSKFLNEENDMRKKSKVKDFKIKDIIPAVEAPKPKRNLNRGQIKTYFKNYEYVDKISGKPTHLKSEAERKKKAELSKQINRRSQNIVYKFCPEIPLDQERQYQNLVDILSYYFGEFSSGDKSGGHKNPVYMNWQLEELNRNYQDTNLGDFIIKMPNPDCMPKDLSKNKDDEQAPEVSFSESFEHYDEMYSTEKSVDKNLDQNQKKCFLIAFYLINIEKSVRDIEIEGQAEFVREFLQIYNYFLQISHINYIDYLNLQKDPEFKSSEDKLDISVRKLKAPMEAAYRRDGTKISEFEELFFTFKKDIYELLSERISSDEDIWGNKKVLAIFQQINLSVLLRNFPRFLIKLRKEAYREIIKDFEAIKRKLYGGNYLKKASSEGELKWVRSSSRPQDILTLLRNILIYRLSRRGGLFIRSFLSQDENFIFLVIKASEQHLEKMAQKLSFRMEVELGATDIFSFIPVDKYNRPLYTNKYIRDRSFIKKYNLATNKADKDEDQGENSIESSSVPLYEKAQKMNEEELRAKVILDQGDADDCFKWLSKVTGVRHIHPNETLNNQYNKDEIDEDVWPIYYIYNKMIIEGLQNLKKELEGTKTGSPLKYKATMDNLGLILRLIFLRSLFVCNELYKDHRNVFFRGVKNTLSDTNILKTVWDKMTDTQPRSYWKYFSSNRFQRIWRKYEISEEKSRSKFSPAARIIITNDIVRQYINITNAMTEKLILDYFPIHDPYILKNILIRPYLNVIKNQMKDSDGLAIKQGALDPSANLKQTLAAYECEYTKEDFTKKSIVEKLKFKCRELTSFSVNSVCFYCGEKLAFYFQFRRFLSKSALPFIIIAFIIQIVFWVELGQIYLTGSSQLKEPVDYLILIFVFINVLWVDRVISNWKEHEKALARSFGTDSEEKKDATFAQKRILFVGTFKRNMETDEMNDEQASGISQGLRSGVAFFINIVFVVCMGATILIIFALKTQMYQQGLDQQLITIVPSILIALAVQVFNFLYAIIVKLLVDFENKKTIPEYESSLSSKSFVITFIVTFYALFIYGFFSTYFEGSDVCTVKTQSGLEVENCYYYMSSQITTSALVEFAVTIVMGFVPLIMFRVNMYLTNKGRNQDLTFNTNYFESVDKFYEEQSRMQSYMFTDEIDKTWQGYTKVVVSFSMLIMFGPIVPFLYFMIFVNGVVSLHAKKYEIIYLSKRGLPIRVSSIGSWITMMEVVSVLGVFTNLAVVAYVRDAFPDRKSLVFFTLVFIILILKYAVNLLFTPKQDLVGKRCKNKITELIHEKGLSDFSTKTEAINTDIENLYYDEVKLNRRLPNLKSANIKFR